MTGARSPYVFAGLLLLFLAGFALWREALNYQAAMTAVTAREAAFVDLIGANKKIAGVSTEVAQGSLVATVRFSGERAGAYRLVWQIAPTNGEPILLSGERDLTLDRATDTVAVTVSLDDIQRQYQSVVLAGRGRAVVDEMLRIELFFDPVLTDQEHANLPPGEQRRLGGAESPLRTTGAASFPLRFEIP